MFDRFIWLGLALPTPTGSEVYLICGKPLLNSVRCTTEFYLSLTISLANEYHFYYIKTKNSIGKESTI
jgi:hypothetical protein